MDRVLVYKDKAGEWRWKRVAGNNRVVSDSGEGYKRRWRAVWAAKRQNPNIQPEIVND